MKSMATIPTEIIIQILQMLQCKRTLYQCTLVCRSMRETAMNMYYADITLDSQLASKILNARASKRQTMLYSKYVKKLNICYDVDIRDKFSSLLIEHFNNITIIDFSQSHLCHQYMLLLVNNIPSDLIKLEEIRPPLPTESQTTILLYYQACFKFRQTLRKYYTDCLIYLPDQPNFNLLNTLPNFLKLTHLAIKNSRNLPGITSDIFLLIRFCPNLISFKLVCESIPVFTTKDSTLDYPNTKLKALDVQFPSMSSSYFNYFVTHLANYHELYTFNLYLYEECIYNWIQGNDLKSMIEFARILTRSTQSLSIQITSSDQSVLTDHMSDSVIMSIMKKYWSFLYELKQDRVIHSIISTTYSSQNGRYDTDYAIQMLGNAICLTERGYQVLPFMEYNINPLDTQPGPDIVNSLFFKNIQPEKAILTLQHTLNNYKKLDYLSISLEEKYCNEPRFFSLESSLPNTHGTNGFSKATLHYCKEISRSVINTLNRVLPCLKEIVWTEHSIHDDTKLNMSNMKHLKSLTINLTDLLIFHTSWCLYLVIDRYKKKKLIYKSANTLGFTNNVQTYRFVPCSKIKMDNHFQKALQTNVLPIKLTLNCRNLDELTFLNNRDSMEIVRFVNSRKYK